MSHPPERRSDRSAEGPFERRFERRAGGRGDAAAGRDGRSGPPSDRPGSPRRPGRWSSAPSTSRRRRFPGSPGAAPAQGERPWGEAPSGSPRPERRRPDAAGRDRPFTPRRAPFQGEARGVERRPGREGGRPNDRPGDRLSDRRPERGPERFSERFGPPPRRPFSAPPRGAGTGSRRPDRGPRLRPTLRSDGIPSRFQAPAPGEDALQGQAESHAPAAPSDLIWGRHSAQAALESGRPIHRIWCTHEMRFSPRFLQLLREAKASGVLVEEVTWARLGQISGGAVHQGIVLQPAAAATLDLRGLIEGCQQLGEASLLVAVDGLTDPQNLGAIVRSAEALGAHGLVLPQRRSAGLTGSVAKVAAGALEHLPVARVVNLNRSLETLKQEGYRVIGLASEGTLCLEEADLDGPLVLVTGSEGDGLSLLTRRSCDQLVRIPLRGSTPSLNASVATALLLYEVARRSWMAGLRGSAPAPRLQRPQLPVSEPVGAVDTDDDSPVSPPLEDGVALSVAEEPGAAQAAEARQAPEAVPGFPDPSEPSPVDAAAAEAILPAVDPAPVEAAPPPADFTPAESSPAEPLPVEPAPAATASSPGPIPAEDSTAEGTAVPVVSSGGFSDAPGPAFDQDISL
ncbi:MAG: 23S rRNA (guanosine(2251)-2'-O)-methyltransferase RlmB [Synechococcaceae cyanobacterium]|nr:23S rRNA (guanosine(2251)-2'-O)-methyltransferase RlmB [Synechococcaceae cyanobacterium]